MLFRDILYNTLFLNSKKELVELILDFWIRLYWVNAWQSGSFNFFWGWLKEEEKERKEDGAGEKIAIDSTYHINSLKNWRNILKIYLIWQKLVCQTIEFLLYEEKRRFITIKWAKYDVNSKKVVAKQPW